MHDVITGFYQPNEIDVENGITAGSFGTTVNIAGGSNECGLESLDPQTARRVSYFVNFLAEFGLEPSDDDTTCSGKLSYFP